jgi:hypothetical protein
MDIASACAALAQQASMATEYALMVGAIAFVIGALSILYRTQVAENLRLEAKKRGLRVGDDFFTIDSEQTSVRRPAPSSTMRSPKTDDQTLRPSRLSRDE